MGKYTKKISSALKKVETAASNYAGSGISVPLVESNTIGTSSGSTSTTIVTTSPPSTTTWIPAGSVSAGHISSGYISPLSGTTSGSTVGWVTRQEISQLVEESEKRLKEEITEIKASMLAEIASLDEKFEAVLKALERLSVRICEKCQAHIEQGQVHICLTEYGERQKQEEKIERFRVAMIDRNKLPLGEWTDDEIWRVGPTETP